MKIFRAFRVEETRQAGKTSRVGRFVSMDETMLDAGDVLIRVICAAVSHRDALAATGQAASVRRFPCVVGTDLAGVVVSSAAPRFRPGDRVIATSHELGVSHHGGYAEYALVPGGWVLPLPAGLSLEEAMAIGSPGFAAALAITRMEAGGLKPENGPVMVTGATGGVGSLAVDMLGGRGYEVAALTRKTGREEWLKSIGAASVLPLAPELVRHALDKGRWAGVVDVLGGDVLSGLLASTKPNGMVASVGMLSGTVLNTTLMPFVLRGVSILGIDSVYAGFSVREKVWERLSGDLKPRHLQRISQKVGFDALPDVFEKLIAALACGRTVVQIAPAGDTEDSP
jgi:acrylyl-CoA reductase (NADPH)